MTKVLRIGTRDSQLALWQANTVKDLLMDEGCSSELVYIKSEGDIDLKTPLYEIGVQGIFTRSLDIALLNKKIDIAVHSLKDVPTQLPAGLIQAAVLKRGSYKDILVPKAGTVDMPAEASNVAMIIATSSIRRKAQWLNRYPNTTIENLRGNVNTRLQKLAESIWSGAIFAAAGLERINLRPGNAVELDWMLPAPAQGAVVIVCRAEDKDILATCKALNDEHTALCTQIERDFLRTLMGGCSTPISGLAEVLNEQVIFQGNILSIDGLQKATVNITTHKEAAPGLGTKAAEELLLKGGKEIAEKFHDER